MSDRFLPMTEEFSSYLHDESKTVGTADSISFPSSEAEVRETLRRCAAAGIPVTVQGNRSGLCGGCVPHGGHILSLDRMCGVNGMRIDESGTVFLRVQPGLSLISLRQMLAVRQMNTRGWDAAALRAYATFEKLPRQYFPPDPTESSASIGGMVSCNSSGAKTYHYGPTRPFVSALRLALTDGDMLSLHRGECFASGRNFTLTTEGGRTIRGTLPSYRMPDCKNASGFFAADDMDLIDLVIGSDGTLGVLTEIELRLIPEPKELWGVNCFFRSEAQAVDFTEAVRPLGLAALEYFDGHALDILRNYKDGGVPVPPGFASLIYAEIHAECTEDALNTIRALGKAMVSCGADPAETWVARNSHDRERLLELRHKVPESVNALIALRKREIPGLAKVGSDMAVPDERLRDVLALYHRDLDHAGFEYAYWGHIGNNHLHINVLPRNMDDMARGKEMFARWAEAVVDMGGTVSAEHGVGKNKTGLLRTLYGDTGLREMAAVKRQFDPDCILSAGNMFPAEYV